MDMRRSTRHRTRRGRGRLPLAVALERLERRHLLATVEWISDADGFWDDATKWSTGTVPGGGDDVVIDRTGANPVVTIRDDRSVWSLRVGDTLAQTAGTLSATLSLQVTGLLTMAGGRINSSTQLMIASGGTLDLRSGQLVCYGASGLANAGTLSFSTDSDKGIGGTFHNDGTIIHAGAGIVGNMGAAINNNASGTYRFTGSGTMTQNAERFNNRGTVRMEGTGTARFGGTVDSAYFNHLGGAIVVDSGTVRLNRSDDLPATSPTTATFTVAAGGLVDLTGGSPYTHVKGTFTGSGEGRVELSSGQITSYDPGATFNFPAGLFHWTGGVLDVRPLRNTGFIQIDCDTAALRGTIYNTGTIVHDRGEVLNYGSAFNNEAGGTYRFTGSGTMTQNAERFNNRGTVRMEGTGTARFGGTVDSAYFNHLGGAIVVDSGTVRLNRSDDLPATSPTTATFTVAAGGLVDLTGGSPYTHVKGTFTGSGEGRVELSSGQITSYDPGATFNFPAGLFHWTGGTIDGRPLRNTGFVQFSATSGAIASSFLNAGTFVHSGEGTLGGGGTLTNQVGGTYRFTGSGTLAAANFVNESRLVKSAGAGTATISSAFANSPTGVIAADVGLLHLTGGGRSTGGAFEVAAGSLVQLTSPNGATFTMRGTYTGSGQGRVAFNALIDGPGDVLTTFDFPTGMLHAAGQLLGTITNAGELTLDPAEPGMFMRATLTNTGTVLFTGPGNLYLNANSRIVNAGLFDVRTDADLVVNNDASAGQMTFLNRGRLVKSTGLGTTSLRHDGTRTTFRLDNVGVVEVASGTLSIDDTIAQLEGSTLRAGGEWIVGPLTTLAMPNATAITTNNAVITLRGESSQFPKLAGLTSNAGRIRLAQGRDFTTTGNFTNSGTLQIGPDSTFAVAGRHTQLEQGSLAYWYRADGNAQNSAVNSRHGILFGNPTYAAGRFGQAFSFDGNGDYIQLSGGASGLYEFTIAAWVKRTSANWGAVAGDSELGLHILADGRLALAGWNSVKAASTSPLITDSEFHHIGLSFNGGTVDFFVDGQLRETVPYTVFVTPALFPFYVGGLGATNQNFTGLIDEVAIYSRKLGETELAALMTGNDAVAAGRSRPSIGIEVAGPGSGTAYGRLTATSSATLAGTFDVTTASGFVPSPVDAYQVLSFSSRSGQFASITGVTEVYTVDEQATRTILTGAAATPPNLEAGPVTFVPTAVPAGGSLSISYDVNNASTSSLTGDWVDSLYLSSDDAYGLDDLLLARVSHSGGLAPRGSYSETVTVPIPGVVGSYRVLLLVNSRGTVGESDRADNFAASAASLAVDVPTLAYGTSLPGTIAAGSDAFYRLAVSGTGDVLLSASFETAGQAEFFVRRGALPTRSQFDFAANDLAELRRTITLASPEAGDWYLLVHGREGSGLGRPFTLDAERVDFALTRVAPARGSNRGRATVVLEGAGFTADTQVSLLADASVVTSAVTTRLVSPNRLYATFDLIGVAAGDYDIRASRAGLSDRLTAAYHVVTGEPGRLQVDLVLPGAVRASRLYTGFIDYRNAGDTDIPAPLLEVRGSGGDFAFDLANPVYGTEHRLLATSPEGPTGTLGPGQSRRVPFLFRGADMTIEVLSMTVDATATMDWQSFATDIRPSQPLVGWDTVFANVFTGLGDTEGDYVRGLAAAASLFQARRGSLTSDPDTLHAFMLGEGFVARDLSLEAAVVFADTGRPAVGLVVTATRRGDGQVNAAVVAADGAVRFTGLAAGTYDISFAGALAPTELDAVTVTATGHVNAGAWRVGRGGGIAGRVIVAGADSLAGIAAQLPPVTATHADGRMFQTGIDAEGLFGFRGLPAGTYTLRFRTDNTRPAVQTGVVVTEGQTTPLVTLLSAAAATIRGRVVDAATAVGIENVGVFVETDVSNVRVAVTDATGAYTLTGVTPGTVTVTFASALAPLVSVAGVAAIAAGTTTGVDAAIDRRVYGSVAGVVSAAGAPLARATVDLVRNGSIVRSTLTDELGRYTLDHAPPGDHQLRVSSYGFRAAVIPVALTANATVAVDVPLEPVGRVTGRVTMPVAGQSDIGMPRLSLVILDESERSIALQTDDDGRFHAAQLGQGEYVLMLADGSHRTPFTVLGDDDAIELSLRLEIGVIRGRFLESDGSTAVVGLLPTLVRDGQTVAAGHTFDDGSFVFFGVTPGTYAIHFRTLGTSPRFFAPRVGVVLSGTATDVGTIVAAPSSLRVEFRDGANAALVSDGLVTIVPVGQPDAVTRVVPVDDGVVSIDGLGAGEYIVTANVAGAAVRRLRGTLAAGANSLEIRFGEQGELRGVVRNPAGDPVAGATVWVRSGVDPALLWSAISDATGSYSLTLPVASYVVAAADLRTGVSGERLGPAQTENLAVVNGVVVTRTLTLSADGRVVSGIVNRTGTAAGTRPLGGSVTLLNADGLPVVTAVIDVQGGYSISPVPPGNYTLRTRAPGFAVADVAFTVGSQVDATIDPIAPWAAIAAGVPPMTDAPTGQLALVLTPTGGGAPADEGDAGIRPAMLESQWEADPARSEAAATSLRGIVRKLLGEPGRNPIRYEPGAIPEACPEASEAFREVARLQRIADEFFNTWYSRWEGAQDVAFADIGLFGVALGKFASGLLFSAPNVLKDSKISELVSERETLVRMMQSSAGDDLETLRVIQTTLFEMDEVIHKLAVAFFANWESIASYRGALASIPGTAISTAGSSPDAVEFWEAWYNISKWDSLGDFSDFLAKVSNFGSNVLQWGDMISKIVVSLGKIPATNSIVQLLGPIGDFCAVFSAAAQGVADSVVNIRDLAVFEGEYLAAIARRDAAFESFLDILQRCLEKERKKTKKPKEALARQQLAALFVVRSFDPNDIIGPAGTGLPARHMRPEQNFPYTILYENKSDATAAAQEVFVTQRLDPDLDWSTFRVGNFGFGDVVFEVPEGRSSYFTTVDLRATHGYVVTFEVGVNLDTGLASWTLRTIDPETGDLPIDALAGFLPPNDATHRGEGFVTYTIAPRGDRTSGTTIQAEARIVFDDNAPIDTPRFTNTIDAGSPTSAVLPLPAVVPGPSFPVTWSGNDDGGGAGVARYDVYVSEDTSPWTLWQAGTSATTASYPGRHGRTYRFLSIATDAVGWRESATVSVEASTTVDHAAPSGITLVPAVIPENSAPGSAVGLLTTIDEEDGKTYTYALVPGIGADDNARFTIAGNTLRVAANLSYEIQASYSIRVRVTDSFGLAFEKVLPVTLSDVAEPLALEHVVSPPAGSHRAGIVLPFTVIYSRPVTVTGRPELSLVVGRTPVKAMYASGSGTNRLTFTFRVGPKHNDANGLTMGATIRVPKGVFIRDSVTRATAPRGLPTTDMSRVLVDTTRPRVTRVMPPAAGTYLAGQAVTFQVAFSEAVTVTGVPTLPLVVGRSARQAGYLSGSGGSTLTFTYVVQPGDLDRDGVVLGRALGLAVPTTIIDAAGNAVTPTVTPPRLMGILVNGQPPVATSLRILAEAAPSSEIGPPGPGPRTAAFATLGGRRALSRSPFRA